MFFTVLSVTCVFSLFVSSKDVTMGAVAMHVGRLVPNGRPLLRSDAHAGSTAVDLSLYSVNYAACGKEGKNPKSSRFPLISQPPQ